MLEVRGHFLSPVENLTIIVGKLIEKLPSPCPLVHRDRVHRKAPEVQTQTWYRQWGTTWHSPTTNFALSLRRNQKRGGVPSALWVKGRYGLD